MKKIILGLLTIMIMISPVLAQDVVKIPYENRTFADDTAITLDGEFGDWADVDGVNITLKPARETGTGSMEMKFRSIHDANKIYFLIVITDDYYFYNFDTGISHRNAAALALAFPIDDNANAQYMGGSDDETDDTLNTTSGMVDIMHWELDTEAGDVTGGSKDNVDKLGDGVANLDDEYSTTPWLRYDDNDAASNNLWKGSWSHTSDMSTNGSTGSWVFELSRDLVSSDKYDATFEEGVSIDIAVAYWSPNETPENVWTDDGHYVNENDVIDMSLVSKAVSAPGFELYLAFLGIFAMIPFLRRRK